MESWIWPRGLELAKPWLKLEKIIWNLWFTRELLTYKYDIKGRPYTYINT